MMGLRGILGRGVAGLVVWFVAQPAAAFLVNEWESMLEADKAVVTAAPPKVGEPWREPQSGMEFLWVAEGCFDMGTPPRSEGRDSDEGPVHSVCLSGFWMARTEMTQGQWQRIMRNNPSRFRQGADFPVERVSWEDIEGMLQKLNARYPGRYLFRLPSEAEWEFVCRERGQNVRFAGGADADQGGWYRVNSGAATHAVGRRAPTRLGFSDLGGNVWEWTLDAYHAEAYQRHERANPVGQGAAEFRVLRGGSYRQEASSLRCGNRGFELLNKRRDDVGLRLVRVVQEKVEERQDIKKLSPF